MPRRIPGFALAVALLVSAPAPAAVLVLANYAEQSITFTLTHPGQPAQSESLAPGQVKPFECGPRVDIRYTSDDKLVALQLEPYEAYVFTGKGTQVTLGGIELAGKATPVDDIRPLTEAAKPVTINVKLLVDDADRRTRRAWEPVLRRRFNQAADQIAAQCPVRFTLTAFDEWPSEASATNLDAVMTGFRLSVKPEPAQLAVGFTSRLGTKFEPGKQPPFGVAGAGQPHLLIREGDPKAESERVEVLTHYLATYLGAVPSPDPASVMRTPLGDGKAMSAKFRVQLDPLNVLAINLWAEALRSGQNIKPADLPSATKARLRRVYQTLANAQRDEPVPAVLTALSPEAAAVKPVDPPVVVAAKPPVETTPNVVKPAVAVSPKPETARVEAVRKVVSAVVIVAETNANGAKLRGDELTNLYIKTAAGVARFEDAETRPAAFLLGLGIALDDSDILRKNPLSAGFCGKVESEDERKRRLAVLGTPTVRGRRDLCQHFVVSAFLAESVGAALAEQAGLAKEMLDMGRASGFSFSDLSADLAGIEFAKLVKRRPDLLEEYPLVFNVNDFTPKTDGLRDGLSTERFKADYGAVGDDRFKAAMAEVRKRVEGLPVYAASK